MIELAYLAAGVLFIIGLKGLTSPATARRGNRLASIGMLVAVITAIVDGVVMNLIAAIFGQPSFDSITIDVGDAELFVGTVITAVVTFLIVAFVCFLIVKAYNAMKAPDDDDAALSEVDLLIEIRDELRSRGS